MKQRFKTIYKKIINEKVSIDDVVSDCKTPLANRYIFDLLGVLIKSNVDSEIIDGVLDYHFSHRYLAIYAISNNPISMENILSLVREIQGSQRDYSSLANWLFIESIQPFPFEFIPQFKDIVTIKLNKENSGHLYEDNITFVEMALTHNMVDLDFFQYILDNLSHRYGNKKHVEFLGNCITRSIHYNDDEKTMINNMLMRSYKKHIILNG